MMYIEALGVPSWNVLIQQCNQSDSNEDRWVIVLVLYAQMLEMYVLECMRASNSEHRLDGSRTRQHHIFLDLTRVHIMTSPSDRPSGIKVLPARGSQDHLPEYPACMSPLSH